jgi:hypothetical protein
VARSLAVPALAALLSLCALSACAGGSSLPGGFIAPGGGSAAGGGAAQTLGWGRRDAGAAGAQPSITNPYPFTQGDVFNYVYAETDTTTTPGQPAVKSYVDSTVSETVGASMEFNGRQWTQCAEVSNYTDKNSAHQTTATGTLTTDYYRNFVQNGNVLDYLMGGYTTSDQKTESNGTTVAATTNFDYASPYLIDIIPEAKGSWKEDIANTETGKTVTTTGSSTETVTFSFTRNSDQSYTREASFAFSGGGTYSETDTVAANGSAEDQNNFGAKNPTNGTTTWSAPAKSGSKYFITVVYTPTSGSKTTTQVPDWYPGGGPIKALVSDAKKDVGTTKVPKSCGKATAGQTAVELVETASYLDPEQATYITFTETTYVVSGEGRVCSTRKYTDDTYDNRQTGALTSSLVESSVLGLTSESLKQVRAKGLIVGFN